MILVADVFNMQRVVAAIEKLQAFARVFKSYPYVLMFLSLIEIAVHEQAMQLFVLDLDGEMHVGSVLIADAMLEGILEK